MSKRCCTFKFIDAITSAGQVGTLLTSSTSVPAVPASGYQDIPAHPSAGSSTRGVQTGLDSLPRIQELSLDTHARIHPADVDTALGFSSLLQVRLEL